MDSVVTDVRKLTENDWVSYLHTLILRPPGFELYIIRLSLSSMETTSTRRTVHVFSLLGCWLCRVGGTSSSLMVTLVQLLPSYHCVFYPDDHDSHMDGATLTSLLLSPLLGITSNL